MYNFSKTDIKTAIDKSDSMVQAAKLLGVKYDTFKKYAEKFGLFKTNQPGKNILKGKKYKNKLNVFKDNNRLPSGVLVKWLKLERDWCCEECGITTWNDKPITLEIDHIDGNNSNNNLNNLKVLCPNCHSQTPTWRGRNLDNKKRTQRTVSDDELKTAILESPNVRQALIKVGLTPKGANYNRVYKLIGEINMSDT